MFLDWFIPCLLVVAAIVVLVISLTYKKNKFTTKDLALAAVCLGLSFALSYWKVWENPQGGSITVASMLPIMLFAYIAGFRKGTIAGLAYGLLQFIQMLWFVHPVQVLLDYFLAFGAIGLAGAFKHIKAFKRFDFLLGIITVGLVRFFFSMAAGVVFYQEYAVIYNAEHGVNLTVWAYSALYNSVLLIDSAICLAVAVFMQYSPHFRKFMNYMDDGYNFGARKRKTQVAAAGLAGSVIPENLLYSEDGHNNGGNG